MINSQNNERVFFADRVVLVEGITDRLIVSSLIERFAAKIMNNDAIEVIEVGGKNNFAQYRKLLNALETPSFIVADQDYLFNVGSAETKRLFTSDGSKLWASVTKDKKSEDAKKLVSLLEAAVVSGDVEQLRCFWDYLRKRHRKLKKLNRHERRIFLDDIHRLKMQEATWVLSMGEVEDYLPEGQRQLAKVVELTKDDNWISRLENRKGRNELINMTCFLLSASDKQATKFRRDASQQP